MTVTFWHSGEFLGLIKCGYILDRFECWPLKKDSNLGSCRVVKNAIFFLQRLQWVGRMGNIDGCLVGITSQLDRTEEKH